MKTNNNFAAVAIYGAVGAIYGSLLSLFALAFSGFGHGSYVPMVVISAPIGLFGYTAAFLLSPFLWLVIGMVVGASGRWTTRVLVALLVLHWVSAFSLGVVEYNPSDWRVFHRFWFNGLASRGILVSGILIYLAGQVAALIAVVSRRNRK